VNPEEVNQAIIEAGQFDVKVKDYLGKVLLIWISNGSASFVVSNKV
jgi:hypothetical protein